MQFALISVATMASVALAMPSYPSPAPAPSYPSPSPTGNDGGYTPTPGGNGGSQGGDGSNTGGQPACSSGTFRNARCCATDVLNIADLDCRNPSSSITGSDTDLIKGCAAEGLTAACCVLPILGQGILCQNVNL